jgi:hypothetical protein
VRTLGQGLNASNDMADAGTRSDDVARPTEIARLKAFLSTRDAPVSILSVSGPGGVGKTYLVEHALQAARDAEELVLRADGSNPEARSDFFVALEGLFPRSLPAPARPGIDYFSRLRDAASRHRALVERSLHEASESGASDDAKALLRTLLRAGMVVNRAFPATRRFLDLPVALRSPGATEAAVDDALRVAARLRVLRDSTKVPGPLRDLFGVTRENRLKNDLPSLVAEDLRTDLAAALAGYEGRDRMRLLQPRIEGLKSVLIVIDDFELLAPLLNDFLIGSLIPQLKRAPFRTRLLLVSRDDLVNLHPGWEQHVKDCLRDQIRLQPFDRATTETLFRDAGMDETRIDALWNATLGYPFLVGLAIEESRDPEADSVVSLRRFVDRTTRWLLPHEREWFFKLVYVDPVNLDTLAAFFPPEEATLVQEWFEREASIRDPAGTAFRVRPLVRDKVLRYLAVRAPSQHRKNLALASAEAV